MNIEWIPNKEPYTDPNGKISLCFWNAYARFEEWLTLPQNPHIELTALLQFATYFEELANLNVLPYEDNDFEYGPIDFAPLIETLKYADRKEFL